jgi:hypothetical protein
VRASRSAAGASVPVRAVAALVGVRGCPLRRLPSRCLPLQHLKVRVVAIISRDGAAMAVSLNLDLRCCRTRCICRRRCFHLRSGCCQLRRCQPWRPFRRRSGLCRRSLVFLCHSEFGFLPLSHARGDRALRLSCGHGAPPGDCYVERELPLMSCCSSEQGRREQRQPELLLLLVGAAARLEARLEKGLSRRCSGYRIVRLRYHLLVAGFLLLVLARSLLSSRG